MFCRSMSYCQAAATSASMPAPAAADNSARAVEASFTSWAQPARLPGGALQRAGEHSLAAAANVVRTCTTVLGLHAQTASLPFSIHRQPVPELETSNPQPAVTASLLAAGTHTTPDNGPVHTCGCQHAEPPPCGAKGTGTASLYTSPSGAIPARKEPGAGRSCFTRHG